MKLFWSIVLICAAHSAEARNFYRSTSTLDLTYTSIYTGTQMVVRSLPIEIRYSDDNNRKCGGTYNCESTGYCMFYAAGFQASCKTLDSNGGYWVRASMDKAQWIEFFNFLGQRNLIPYQYFSKLLRVTTNLNFTYLEALSTRGGIYYQLDDNAPEAFHLNVPLGTKPQLL